ncbi:unnamed protein product [Chrysodeixis includens]|uniref:Uncharacterized protein n=1 Tax=Chrysodeixis includens TaxID=689277 RepID=A0A9N8L5C6_CHRIL|nr:unnamed protein product [Chrysodeixis includens]
MALPTAQPAEVLRAWQKDDLYEKQLAESLSKLMSARHASKAVPLSSVMYRSLTTLKDLQTLGEEYSGIVQVDETYNKLPGYYSRMDMDVDGNENLSNPSEGGKFSNLKAFVNAAREFEATHSESAVNLMTRYLGEISYGIKISWQESYLSGLMKQLTEWITQPMTEPQHRTIGHKSLTVLVNVCYANLPAIYALMRTVDTKDFVVHLISLKEGGYGGVEVCRLLLCLSGATRGAASTRQPDVHSYLCCTMRTFNKAVSERDATQLLHAYTFINDLCTDPNLQAFVLTYPNFMPALEEGLKDVKELCRSAPDDMGEPENATNCLRNALKFLTVLVNLDLYSMRSHHGALICLCMEASRMCLPESLELFAAIVSQYKDEGRLPQELISVISDGLPGLIVPPSLEPGKAGLQWLQVIGALCEAQETQERVLQEVTPDAFEDTLYSVLQYTSQNGVIGAEASQQAVVVGCRTALALAPLQRTWQAALQRMLAHHQVHDTLPSRHDTLPGRHDTLPGRHDTLPGRHDTLPSRHDTLPGRHDTLPGRHDTLPARRHDTLPGRHDTLPGRHDTLPSRHDTLPGRHDTLPGRHDTLPGRHDTLPGRHDTLPGRRWWWANITTT